MAMPAEVDSHTAAMRASVPKIAGELEELLGQRLTAVIAGVSDAKAVARWARGERAPRPDAEQRLLADDAPRVLQAARTFLAHG
jgi:hypothetical protein